MSVGYNPRVNDYVVWTTELGQVHKGWVYFVADKSEKKKGWQTPARYFSLEIATKPRPDCDLAHFSINVFTFVYVALNQIGMK